MKTTFTSILAYIIIGLALVLFVLYSWNTYQETGHVFDFMMNVEHDGHLFIKSTDGMRSLVHHPDCPKCKR